jgi:hypothetical protein
LADGRNKNGMKGLDLTKKLIGKEQGCFSLKRRKKCDDPTPIT